MCEAAASVQLEISKNITFPLAIPCIFMFLKQVHLSPQNVC